MAENNNHFGLRLDTEGPSLSITGYSPATSSGAGDAGGSSTYFNTAVTVTLSCTDRATAKYYHYYIDDNEEGSPAKMPQTWIAATDTSINILVPINSSPSVNYLHVEAMDDVGNVSAIATSKKIVYFTGPLFLPDYTLPGCEDTFALDNNSAVTNSLVGHTITVRSLVNATALVREYCPGFKKITVSGPIAGSPITVAEYTEAQHITDTAALTVNDIVIQEGDGYKDLTLTITDYAGNVFEYSGANGHQVSTEDKLLKAETTKWGWIKLDTTVSDFDVEIITQSGDPFVDPSKDNNLAVKVTIDEVGHDIETIHITINGVTTDIPATSQTTEYIKNYDALADGNYTVEVTVTDSAQTTSDAKTATFAVDTVKPMVDCAYSGSNIVKVGEDDDESWWIDASTSSTKTYTITYTASDAFSGIDNWTLTQSEAAVATGTTRVIDGVTSARAASDLMSGANAISMAATDKAGNTNNTDDDTSGTARISRRLYGDKDAASIADVTLNTWYNGGDPFAATLMVTDFENNGSAMGSGISEIWVWVSTEQNDTTPPNTTAGATGHFSYTLAEAKKSVTLSLSKSDVDFSGVGAGTNYLHIRAKDNVGHISQKDFSFGYDSTSDSKGEAPSVTAYSADSNVYRQDQTATMTASASDATSGLAAYKYVDFKGVESEWIAVTSVGAKTEQVTFSIKLDGSYGPDGHKTSKIKFKDVAENEGEWFTITNVSPNGTVGYIEYDTTPPSGSVATVKADGVTAKESTSSIRTFKLVFSNLLDNISATATRKFKIRFFGDIDGHAVAPSWEDVPWVEIPAGEDYTTDELQCTLNAGETAENKYVKAEVMDNAGNTTVISTGTDNNQFMFTYDPIVAKITVSDVDYTVVSKVHRARWDSANSPIDGTFCDKMTFNFAPSKEIVAWKVCAYPDQATAKGVTDPGTQVAIPTTGGSIATSGTTSIAATVKTLVTIMGADYETALRAFSTPDIGENGDGIHYVVVYGQNKAGDWSEAAIFN